MNKHLEEMNRKVIGVNDEEGCFADVVKMDIETYHWFYEQAKQTQELKDKVNTLEESNNELAGVGGMWMSARNQLEVSQEQNERLRKGIKDLYLSLCKGGKYDHRIDKRVAYNLILDIEKIDEDLKKELDNALEIDLI